MLLLVDADPAFLVQAEGQLGAASGGIFFAASARQATDLIRDVGDRIALVFVSLDLPDGEGPLLIQELRQHFPDLAVFAVSSGRGDDAREKAKALGAVDLLRKPITPAWSTAMRRIQRKQVG